MTQEDKYEPLKVDFDMEISKKGLISGFIVTVIFSLVIGVSLGGLASPDDRVKEGITEVCHKFGAEEAVSASYSGTLHSGNLTVNCSFSGDSLDTFQITIPVERVSAQVSEYNDEGDTE